MAPVLSLYMKRRIVTLANLGNRFTTISKILLDEENKKVSRQAVAYTVHKFRISNSLSSVRRLGRKRKLTQEHLNFIDESYEKNDELTSPGKILYTVCVPFTVVVFCLFVCFVSIFYLLSIGLRGNSQIEKLTLNVNLTFILSPQY